MYAVSDTGIKIKIPISPPTPAVTTTITKTTTMLYTHTHTIRTYGISCFPHHTDGQSVLLDKCVAHLAYYKTEYPHAQVRQRAESCVLGSNRNGNRVHIMRKEKVVVVGSSSSGGDNIHNSLKATLCGNVYVEKIYNIEMYTS